MHLQPVPIPKFYRLINHGPTVLVSAQHSGTVNAMSASWACALDFDKLTVVLDKSAYTRGLIERTGSADDRRAAVVTLTVAGRDALEAAAPGHAELVRSVVFDGMSRTQAEAVRRWTLTVLERLG